MGLDRVNLFAQAGWMPHLANTLSWWQWAMLAAVPPAILLLYFLKLKRHPLEVPSTYLWHRSIEDLHVNTIWQRLRKNLLLFLQLLLILLAILALLRPGWRGSKAAGGRSIFLIDNSASMQATDADASRLAEAKARAETMLAGMDSEDVAMIVSFADADATRIVQMFTDNRRLLKQSLEKIEPSVRSTTLAEALEIAGGLANPGRSGQESGDFLVADPLPATLYVISDGKFAEVSDFRLGNLDPVFVPIGLEEAANVGILQFSVRRDASDPSQLHAFARLENFAKADVSVSVDLLRWDPKLPPEQRLIDSDVRHIGAGETLGVAFKLAFFESGALELRINAVDGPDSDQLACDNVAWAAINPPEKAKVLLVTPGNQVLDYAFHTRTVGELAELVIESPEFLDEEAYLQSAASGVFDLVIFDRCRPKEMPQSNTFFIGAVPPAPKSKAETAPDAAAGDEEADGPTDGAADEEAGSTAGDTQDAKAGDAGEAASSAGRVGWRAGARVSYPAIIDVDPAHPLMQWLQMGDVEIDRGTPLEIPAGGTVLIDTHAGPMFAVAPRGGYEDAVLGFALVDQEAGEGGQSETYIGTNWWMRASFPVFVLNLLHYLGGTGAALEHEALRPGQPVVLESPVPGKTIRIVTPAGKTLRLKKRKGARHVFTRADELGVYEVRFSDKTTRHFAVNFFHAPESDIAAVPKIQIGRGEAIHGEGASWETMRREMWKWLLLLAVGVLLVEWYVYHRRISFY